MSTSKRTKPGKPTPDFPLSAHDSGQWAKKIKGRLEYFGKWNDPDAALQRYHDKINPPSTKGAKPVSEDEGVLTVRDACNHFLGSKDLAKGSGALSELSCRDYEDTCERVIEFFGGERVWDTLTPLDFNAYRAHVMKTRNVVSTGNEVTRVKTMINWLIKSDYIDECDVGPDFKKQSAKVSRKHKRQKGKKIFEADQILAIFDEAGLHLQTMILL